MAAATSANTALTAASPLRVSRDDPASTAAGSTVDLSIASLTIPNNRPVAGQSFQIEAFGTIGPTAAATAFSIDIMNGSVVLATATVRPAANAGVRSWTFSGWVHVGTYTASTQVSGLRARASLTVTGLAPDVGAAVIPSASITALSARIRTVSPNPSQVTACMFATIIEVRPQFSGTPG